MSFFRDQLEEWLKQLEVAANRVIDVGGAAKPVKGRTASWNVGSYIVADNLLEDDNAKDQTVVMLDLNAPLPEDWGHTADAVFVLEVMEYVYDPMTAMRNLARMVEPGGRLYISFPFVYPMHKPLGSDFLRYTEEGVMALLLSAGFKIRELRPRVARDPELLNAFYSSDGMHSRRDDTVSHTGYLVIADKE